MTDTLLTFAEVRDLYGVYWARQALRSSEWRRGLDGEDYLAERHLLELIRMAQVEGVTRD